MRRRGFTLVELMVYLVVLGVVGAAVVSVELVVRRSTSSETGALIALDDERRVADRFVRDVESAVSASTRDGVRELELRIPATRDGKRVPGKLDTVTWRRDTARPNILLRESDSPFKDRDASSIVAHSCDGLTFRIEGRAVTAEVAFASWEGATLIARRAFTYRAARRVTGEEEK